jgi:tRNA dimethylallyltransferase
MRPRVLVIVGPTASGKSDLAVKLAKKLNGEVISADSRQVYKGLDAGTGKISKKEMQGVPHYLLDVASPKKQFTVSEYKKLALKKMEEILKRKKLPIIVGGTGFYIDALRMNLPEVPPNQKLRKELEKKSVEELVEILGKHEIKDKKNKVRLIRAIEIVEALGHIPELEMDNSKYNFEFIGLNPNDLQKRIEKRLKNRLTKIVTEVKKLRKNGVTWKRFYELGLEYRYVGAYVQGKMDIEEMSKELFKEIIRYSKRQMTWFNRNKNIKWFESASSAFVYTTQSLRVLQRTKQPR